MSCGRSVDADRIRPAEVRHAVEDRHGDGDLDGLRLVGVEAQAIADNARSGPPRAPKDCSHFPAAKPSRSDSLA